MKRIIVILLVICFIGSSSFAENRIAYLTDYYADCLDLRNTDLVFILMSSGRINLGCYLPFEQGVLIQEAVMSNRCFFSMSRRGRRAEAAHLYAASAGHLFSIVLCFARINSALRQLFRFGAGLRQHAAGSAEAPAHSLPHGPPHGRPDAHVPARISSLSASSTMR